MKLLRRLAVLVLIAIFLFGLGVLLYPYVEGYLVDKDIRNAAQDFLSWVEITPYVPDSSGSHVLEPGPARPAIPEPTEPSEYGELWREMQAYNLQIYQDGQRDLDGKQAYESPAFR